LRAWSASGFAQTTIPENDPYLQDYILTHPLGEPPPDYSEISSAPELILVILLIAIAILLIRLRHSPAWQSLIPAWLRFLISSWLRLSEHLRRGLTRLYLVVAVPWTAWFGYRLLDAHNPRLAFDAFWSLLIVPIGFPIATIVVLWVIAGFQEPTGAASSTDQPESSAARAKHYYAIIADAVSQLENKDKQARATLYAQARTILVDKLNGQNWGQFRRECKALENAIRQFEAQKRQGGSIEARRRDIIATRFHNFTFSFDFVSTVVDHRCHVSITILGGALAKSF
jgi:hypothetical protein